MNVKIKRIDKSLPLPVYQTKGAAGFDILCRKNTEIKPKEVALIPGNIIVKVPDGYMLLLALRSSVPRKKGLLKPHGVGILDNDYCGEEDELMIQVYNYTEKTVTVEKGERIAQGIFVKRGKFEWEESEKMASPDRGGFGSTG